MSENVYNLIPRVENKRQKPPRHESRFNTTVKDEFSKSKEQHKTMGLSKENPPQPQEFLKKRTGDAKLPERKKFQYSDSDRRRPPVPKPEDAPLHGLRTTKNFISQNAVENIMSVPKKPQKNYVDTRNGDTFPLDPSGFEPVYRARKDYGEVPEYLIKRQDEIRRAQEEYDNYVAEMYRRNAMQQLTAEDRDKILCGLKENWEELHHQYQSLSLLVDTIPKKNRKELLESKMQQLERDIELMEKHSIIYIAN